MTTLTESLAIVKDELLKLYNSSPPDGANDMLYRLSILEHLANIEKAVMWRPIEEMDKAEFAKLETRFLAKEIRMDGSEYYAVCYYDLVVTTPDLNVEGATGYEWDPDINPTHFKLLDKPEGA